LRHKMWPDAYWPDLCERILAKRPNTQFVYVGSKSERPLGDAIMKRVGRRCWNFAGLLSLSGTADMLQQCGRMICNDTGLLHVADAVGCRVVSIWGPTFFTKNEPLNSKASGRTVAVRSDGGGCPHFPCLHKPEMSRCKNPICIAAVTVDRVLEACDNGI